MCGEDEEESKDGEGEVCVGLRWYKLGWCCMCIFGVGEEDGDGMGMSVEAKVSDSEAR